MTKSCQISGIPNLVLIGVPGIASLNKARTKLEDHGIQHLCWSEPDNDMGFTSIATHPLTKESKAPLAKYRLWKPMVYPHACSSVVEHSDKRMCGGKVGGSNPSRRTSSIGPCSSIGRAADSNSAECGFEPRQGLH